MDEIIQTFQQYCQFAALVSSVIATKQNKNQKPQNGSYLTPNKYKMIKAEE